ncbi:hypothetical protein IFM89_026669, partial [Coptis chinensis]
IQERVISTVPDSHIISIPREYEEESIDASLSTNVTVEEKKQVTTVSDAHIGNIYEENDISKGSEHLKEESQSDAGTSCDDIVEEKEQDTTIRNTKSVIFQEENVNKSKGREHITQEAHSNSATSKWVDIVPIKVVVEEPKVKDVWIKHYCSSHKILLVGEGDFSFSACLARAFGYASNHCNMVATSLDLKSFFMENYSKAMSNINDLKNKGCTVIHDFDATAKWDSYLVNGLKFDRIIYNFPHAGFFKGQSEKCQLKRNRHLDLEDLAKQNGLKLIEDVKFKLTNYPGYKTKYGFGGRPIRTIHGQPNNCRVM